MHGILMHKALNLSHKLAQENSRVEIGQHETQITVYIMLAVQTTPAEPVPLVVHLKVHLLAL